MSEYRETRTVVDERQNNRAQPAVESQVESQHDTVVHESHGMSNGAVVALVLAAVAAAVVITILILNDRQRESEDQLAIERARADAADQQPPQNQQPAPAPPVIVVPPAQPTPVPVPVPSASPSTATTTSPTNTEIELDVSSKFLDDQDLRAQSIDVKVSGGTAVLSGQVSSGELKTRAERLARLAKGVRNVINNITVKSN